MSFYNPEDDKTAKFNDIFVKGYDKKGYPSEKAFKEKFINLESLAKELNADLTNGLSLTNSEDFLSRAITYGKNNLDFLKIPLTEYFFESFDIPSKIFLVSALASIIVTFIDMGFTNSLFYSIFIFFFWFILFNYGVYSIYISSNKKKENQLPFPKPFKVNVIREKKETIVLNTAIYVGDVVRLKEGNTVPADCMLINGELTVDEKPVFKKEKDELIKKKTTEFKLEGDAYSCPLVFAGSICKTGQANALVVSVGPNSYINRIYLNPRLEETEEKDANINILEDSVTEFTSYLGDFGFLFSILIGLIIIIKEFVIVIQNHQTIITLKFLNNIFIDVNTFALLLIIGIPESIVYLIYYLADKKEKNQIIQYRKYAQFASISVVTIQILYLLGVFFFRDSMINPIEILWIKGISDFYVPKLFSSDCPTEKKSDDDAKLKAENCKIFPKVLKINVGSQIVFQVICFIILCFSSGILGVESDRGLKRFYWEEPFGYHTTIIACTLGYVQAFNLLCARNYKSTQKNLLDGFKNPVQVRAIFLFIIGQILLVTIGGSALRFRRLSAKQHALCIGIAALTLVVGFVAKFFHSSPAEEKDKGKKKKTK